MNAATPQYRHIVMPAEPASLIIAAAMAALAAGTAAIAATPMEVETFTLVGSLVGMLISVIWLRLKIPTAGPYAISFAVLASLSLGWIFPEPVMWSFFPETTATLHRKAWAGLSLLFSLMGTVGIATIMKLIESRLPTVISQTVERALPGGGKVAITLPVAKPADPPSVNL